MKRTFVKLVKLVDVTCEGETQEARERWLANLRNSGVADGYTLDYTSDANGTYKELSTDEVEFINVACYNFMGSEHEQERFYDADWVTVREKATGDIYALWYDGIEEF